MSDCSNGVIFSSARIMGWRWFGPAPIGWGKFKRPTLRFLAQLPQGLFPLGPQSLLGGLWPKKPKYSPRAPPPPVSESPAPKPTVFSEGSACFFPLAFGPYTLRQIAAGAFWEYWVPHFLSGQPRPLPTPAPPPPFSESPPGGPPQPGLSTFGIKSHECSTNFCRGDGFLRDEQLKTSRHAFGPLVPKAKNRKIT